MIHQILDSLNGLPNGTGSTEFTVKQICQSLYAAKSYAGEPCAIVELGTCASLPGGRQTKGLVLEFHQEFELAERHTRRTGTVAVLRCRDASLTYLFAVMVSGIADVLSGGSTEPRAILEYVVQWQELLATRRELGLNEQLGLWGELWFIGQSRNPDACLRAWRGPERKRFDFSVDGLDLDIKTSLSGHTHHFSLAQVQASSSGSRRLICSLAVEEDPSGGVSLSGLVDHLRRTLQDRILLEKNLLRVGYATQQNEEISLWPREVKLVETEHVPRVRGYDEGVTSISFVSSLEDCPPVEDARVLLERFADTSHDHSRRDLGGTG